jgi:hypothetical protein
MAYRNKVRNKRRDQRKFTATADRTHRKNVQMRPLRGGIRL